nr:hypothetical protein [Tanacetum cinerariifolium]
DNESWNDPRDFAKPVKAISLPQDVPSTSDRHLIKLKNQVQRLMEAYIAPMQPTQVNKITSSCEICSGPNDTQYYMENSEQAFIRYASSRTDEAGEDPQCSTYIYGLINDITIYPKQQYNPHNDKPEEKEQKEKDEPENINTNPSLPHDPSVSFITRKVRNENKILLEAGDGVRIYPDSVVSPVTRIFENFQVIFDEKKLGSS